MLRRVEADLICIHQYILVLEELFHILFALASVWLSALALNELHIDLSRYFFALTTLDEHVSLVQADELP